MGFVILRRSVVLTTDNRRVIVRINDRMGFGMDDTHEMNGFGSCCSEKIVRISIAFVRNLIFFDQLYL